MVEKVKKKVLITGINGMLGEDLFRRLKTNYSIIGIDIRAPLGEKNGYINCDLVDRDKIKEVFKKHNPWLVIHTAAYTDVDGCEKDPQKAELINVQATNNIVYCAQESRAKLIYISTDYVFNGTKKTAYTVDDCPEPLNVYGGSKLRAESIVRSVLKEFLIVRTSWLFGKYGKNFVAAILDKAKAVKKLEVVDDQRGSPTYTVSLSQAIEQLINAVFNRKTDVSNYGTYHITNKGDCSWYEFAKEIVALNKIPVDVIPVDSSRINRLAKRPALSILDNSRFENITGNKLCSWQEALREYRLSIGSIV